MDSTKKTILIIEDEKDIAELLAFNLENDEFNTLLANNGESGIKIARKRKPDLIILDLMLPGIHGLDVCRIIKGDPELKNIFIVMLTALGQEESIVKGLEVGADDYITKPFSFKILIARIRSVIRRSRIDEEGVIKDINIFGVEIKQRSR